MPLVIPNTFVVGTKAKAAEVNENFDAIADLLNVTQLDADEYLLDGSIEQNLFSATLLDFLDAGTSRRGFDEIATSQSTTSASFTDLATVGPSVTVTVPTGGLVGILADAELSSGAGNPVPIVGIHEATDISSVTQILKSVSGVGSFTRMWTTPHAQDSETFAGEGTIHRLGASLLVFPATAGARTYTLKYRSSGGGTASFRNRKLWVITWGNFS